MRRSLLTLAVFGVVGVFVSADAQACHKKKCATPVACAAPAPVVAPCPPPAPVACAPVAKKCGGGFKMPKFGGLCHKKAAPACAPTYAPTYYAAAPSPQVYATGQAHASGQ